MWYSVKEDTSYRFKLQRGVLTDSPAVEQAVGGYSIRRPCQRKANEVNTASGGSNGRSQLL